MTSEFLYKGVLVPSTKADMGHRTIDVNVSLNPQLITHNNTSKMLQ